MQGFFQFNIFINLYTTYVNHCSNLNIFFNMQVVCNTTKEEINN